MDDFKCPACGSSTLVYPKVLEDREPVVCASCGAFVSTYGESASNSRSGQLRAALFPGADGYPGRMVRASIKDGPSDLK
jgi:hypothetical protein